MAENKPKPTPSHELLSDEEAGKSAGGSRNAETRPAELEHRLDDTVPLESLKKAAARFRIRK